jgi:hypothetical protein
LLFVPDGRGEVFYCPQCGTYLDRDQNAAENIARYNTFKFNAAQIVLWEYRWHRKHCGKRKARSKILDRLDYLQEHLSVNKKFDRILSNIRYNDPKFVDQAESLIAMSPSVNYIDYCDEIKDHWNDRFKLYLKGDWWKSLYTFYTKKDVEIYKAEITMNLDSLETFCKFDFEKTKDSIFTKIVKIITDANPSLTSKQVTTEILNQRALSSEEKSKVIAVHKYEQMIKAPTDLSNCLSSDLSKIISNEKKQKATVKHIVKYLQEVFQS